MRIVVSLLTPRPGLSDGVGLQPITWSPIIESRTRAGRWDGCGGADGEVGYPSCRPSPIGQEVRIGVSENAEQSGKHSMTNSTSDEKAPLSGTLAGGGTARPAVNEPIHPQLFRFLERLEMRRGVVWAALIVALSAELVSFFFAATWYDWWMRRFTYLSENPFAVGSQNIDFPEHRLRILGPVIAWALGLRGVIGTLVPVAANVPILMTVYVVVRRRTSLPVAVVSTLLLATTHVTMTSRTLLGYHDSLVFLCLLGAMLCQSWWASSSTFFLALFGDVRAVLVVPFLIAWRLVDQPPERPFRCFVSRLLMYMLVFAVWTVLAILLAHQFQQVDICWSRIMAHLEGEQLSLLRTEYVHLSASMTFKSAWVFPIILCWIWASRRKWLMVTTLISALLIGLLSVFVQDLSRAYISLSAGDYGDHRTVACCRAKMPDRCLDVPTGQSHYAVLSWHDGTPMGLSLSVAASSWSWETGSRQSRCLASSDSRYSSRCSPGG